ncbi:MAG: anti-sigma factor [bacterium]|nr:anti-sigma factor [bacterium]
MNCQEIKIILPDYRIDNVSPSVRQMIKEHLSQCAACSKELEALPRVEFLVNAIKFDEPPAGLWAKIATQIAAKEQVSEQIKISRNIFTWLRLKPVPVFASAIVAFLIFGGLWWQYNYMTLPEPSRVQLVEESVDAYVVQHTVSAFEDPTADKNGVGLMLVSANEFTGE